MHALHQITDASRSSLAEATTFPGIVQEGGSARPDEVLASLQVPENALLDAMESLDLKSGADRCRLPDNRRPIRSTPLTVGFA